MNPGDFKMENVARIEFKEDDTVVIESEFEVAGEKIRVEAEDITKAKREFAKRAKQSGMTPRGYSFSLKMSESVQN